MKNRKNCKKIKYFFFSFPIKIFFKWIINHCPKCIHQHFPYLFLLKCWLKWILLAKYGRGLSLFCVLDPIRCWHVRILKYMAIFIGFNVGYWTKAKPTKYNHHLTNFLACEKFGLKVTIKIACFFFVLFYFLKFCFFL